MTDTHRSADSMDPALKAKWLVALRSGEYKQGVGELCSPRGNEWCCLGVLADVAGVAEYRLHGQDTLSAYEVKRDDLLGPWDKPGDPPTAFSASDPKSLTTVQRKLAAMNDNEQPFEEIAAWIEANL